MILHTIIPTNCILNPNSMVNCEKLYPDKRDDNKKICEYNPFCVVTLKNRK